ncbi:MAG TPA: thioredoxin domain-containing protein [Candidatus Acidoferrum sp.]|nr:thioredoxin domain-containing protein [Candidatus Acidoferrum sp.]
MAGLLVAMALEASAQGTPPPKNAAATIGNEVISISEVEKSSATELAGLEEQRYRVLDRRLGAMIAEKLLTLEAKKRGVSMEALMHAEVTSKVPAVTGEDVNAFISQNRERLPKGDEADLKVKVADYLHRLQLNQRTEAFVAGLREQTPVQVFLKPPDPVRVSVDSKGGFARGPDDAAVTIVEFTDFQCPFCKNVVPTLKDLVTRYGDKVRWVFRDYPIVGLHPDAPLVHEAARCAGEQGKFWLYHDLAFERAPAATPANLKAYAAEVGVEANAFSQCLDSHKHRAAVAADVETGSKLGVTGTPTFFINGQLLVGNQPLAEFQRVVERELGRTAAAPAPTVNPR